MRSLLPIVLGVALLAGLVVGCGQEPDEVPLPDGVSAVLDQTRLQRQGREVFVRLDNRTDTDLRVTEVRLGSTRSDVTRWRGTERVRAGYQGDVDVELPRGRCGDDTRFTAELVYRLGGGDAVRSTVPVEDRYGAVSRVLDADCARETLEAAASLDVGTPVRDGDALRVPVTLTPRDGSSEVRLVGYRPTPLVRPRPDSATDVAIVDDPVRADLVLEPARCDPHAIAEDKVGRLVPVEVSAPGLADGTTFTLPLDARQKVAVLDYVRSACGLA